MADEFDELEEPVKTEMKKVYTGTAIDHATNPRNFGEMANPDGFGVTSEAGETTMKVWLRVKDNRIEDATFWSDGCGASIACGSIATELVRDKTVAQAQRITEHDILDALGGLPQGNVHCAVQAARTLRQAVQDYLSIKNEPWKKAYRRY